jgi:hypothetical protein
MTAMGRHVVFRKNRQGNFSKNKLPKTDYNKNISENALVWEFGLEIMLRNKQSRATGGSGQPTLIYV